MDEKEVDVIGFSYKSATCIVVNWMDGTASLGDVYATERRKGHATNLLKLVIAWADQKGMLLKTAAEAHGPEPKLPQPQLIEFYKKFGFEPLEDISQSYVYMERTPQ